MRFLTVLAAAALPLVAIAHGGESHGEAGAPSTGRDEVTLSKPMQRALAISTVSVQSVDADSTVRQRLTGEVVAHPSSPTQLQAAQPGRLRATDSGWPTRGQVVAANQLLAVIEPQMSLREQSQRRAELAQLEKRHYMANINFERLRLQADASQGLNQNNVWLDQAEAETRGYAKQIELMRQSLAGRVEIRAGQSGSIQSVPVSQGEIVALGQTLFTLAPRAPVRLAVRIYDRALSGASLRAQARIGESAPLALVAAGVAAATPEPGWTLWLDFQGEPPVTLAVGMPITVELAHGPTAPVAGLRVPRACVLGLPQAPYVWVHETPEHFERRPLQIAQIDANSVTVKTGLDADERVVADGAVLLSQYR